MFWIALIWIYLCVLTLITSHRTSLDMHCSITCVFLSFVYCNILLITEVCNIPYTNAVFPVAVPKEVKRPLPVSKLVTDAHI